MEQGSFDNKILRKKAEAEPKPANPVDLDFAELDNDFSLEEKFSLMRDLLQEVFNSPSKRPYYSENLRLIKRQGQGDIKHFVLPDMPGGEGDINKIRESYNSDSSYYKSEDRLFLKVGQGEMWVLPRRENPYCHFSMSVCSAIVALDQDKMIVGHISYSTVKETEAMLKFIEAAGISKNNIYVCASIGDYQRRKAAEDFQARVLDKNFYTEKQIPVENILTFDFSWLPAGNSAEQTWFYKNMTQVIVSNEALFKYSFDVKNYPGVGWAPHREEIIGGFKDEELIVFKQKIGD